MKFYEGWNGGILKDKEIQRKDRRKIYGGEKNLIFRKSIRLSVELRRTDEVVSIFHRASTDFLSNSSLPAADYLTDLKLSFDSR